MGYDFPVSKGRLPALLSLALSGCLLHRGEAPLQEEHAFSERLPGSRNHAPNGTWWGYNMTKIARHGDTVFTYVIENDDDAATPSTFRILAKTGDAAWRAGAGFATSRPGNILVDSGGVLHAFVFVPDNPAVNDSHGKLMHVWFPHASAGDITGYEAETAVASDSSCEPVNIRVGAAAGRDDTLAVAFGHLDKSLALAETVYLKKKGAAWTKSVAESPLDHAFYYPFVLVDGERISLLPIQDDQVAPGEPNIYQIIPFFHFDGKAWQRQTLADLRGHPLAGTRRGLLEQSDLFQDASGRVHAVFKEKLDPASGWRITAFKHMIRSVEGQWSTANVNVGGLDLNWLKLAEIGGRLYWIGVSYDALYVFPDGESPRKVAVKDMIKSAYIYTTSPRTGTRDAEAFVDILLISGNRADYPNGPSLYVRLGKADVLSSRGTNRP